MNLTNTHELERLSKKLDDSYNKIHKLTYANMVETKPNGTQRFMMDEGEGVSIGLLKIAAVAVARTRFAPNSLMKYHSHKEKEIIIVFSGSMTVCNGKEQSYLRAGELIELKPETDHAAFTKEDECEFIAITIPSNINFPEAK